MTDHFMLVSLNKAFRDGEKKSQNCTGCKSPCCRLKVFLTRDEIKSGIYLCSVNEDETVAILAEREDGSCVYQLPEGGCSIYEHRPYVCRTYSCATDERVTDRGRYQTGEVYFKEESKEDGVK